VTGLIVYDTVRLFMLPDCPSTLPSRFIEDVNNLTGNSHGHCVNSDSLSSLPGFNESPFIQDSLEQLAPTCLRAICDMTTDIWQETFNLTLRDRFFSTSYPPSRICTYDDQDQAGHCYLQYFLAAKHLLLHKMF
jgi:hypothetical protein